MNTKMQEKIKEVLANYNPWKSTLSDIFEEGVKWAYNSIQNSKHCVSELSGFCSTTEGLPKNGDVCVCFKNGNIIKICKFVENTEKPYWTDFQAVYQINYPIKEFDYWLSISKQLLLLKQEIDPFKLVFTFEPESAHIPNI